MEAAFKQLYDLFLYGYISESNWALTLVMFFHWAIEQEDEDIILRWIQDVRKDHPNPKGR